MITASTNVNSLSEEFGELHKIQSGLVRQGSPRVHSIFTKKYLCAKNFSTQRAQNIKIYGPALEVYCLIKE